jgi:hypothetical protein
MNTDHAIVVSGLRLIQSWLHQRTWLGRLRPTKTKLWRVFISCAVRRGVYYFQIAKVG